jgi:Carboxypeptidase regulatory-like domain/TonB dependent receptor/TonB-dependent Receptor Plug Domain
MSPVVRFLILSFLFVGLGVAQSPNGTISGIVHDPSDRPIPDAEILIVNDLTNIQYQTKTSDEGIYVVTNLPPGPYRIQVTKRGFKTLIKPGLTLNVQDALSVSITLPLGAVNEVVTVEGGAPLVNTESAAVGTVVDRKYVENMPLNGRSFQDLILLTPGVVTNSPQSASTNGGSGEFSVNGQRTESNYYTVDGVSANTGIPPGVPQGDGTTGSVAAATALGTTQALVSVDALQEFRVQSSTYSAEYGRNPGGQFSFVTRSGTNEWHGTAFDYLRNDYFDANNWFNDFFKQPEPPLRQNDFGGTLGGPIEIPKVYDGKDKTFFFFSYEGLRVLQPQASTIDFVPDSGLRQSTPAPLQAVLNAFPLANGPVVGNGLAEFIGTWSNPSSLDAYSLRLDHTFKDKLHVFFRFSDTGSSGAARQTSSPSELRSTSYTSRTYTFGATTAVSNRVSNEFRLNYSSNASSLQNSLDNFGGAEPVNLGQLQQVSPGNAFQVTVGLFLGATPPELAQGFLSGVQKQWNLIDSVSVPFRRHQLKFGIDYRRLTPIQEVGAPQSDYFFFSQSAVQANSADVALSQNFAKIYPLFTNFSAFAQDEWRITQRLNLSLGLRWDVNPAVGVTQGALPLTVQGANDLGTMTLARAGTQAWKTTWFNFAPRLGAAYVLRPTPEYETVLRGGGGLFFDTGQQTGGYGFFSPNFLSITERGAFFGLPTNFPLPPSQALPPISQTPTPPFPEVNVFSPHLQLPYTMQWNVAVEQELGGSQALSVTYVGSHAGRLLERNEVDVKPFNPNFGTVQFFRNGLTADYDALQVQFRRRISHGLTALASYTYGHSIDYGSTDFTLPYVRGNSDFDVRHSFSSAFSYDLPSAYRSRVARAVFGRWGVDDRFTARTSFPVTLSGFTEADPGTGQTFNGGLNLVPGQPSYLYGSQYPGGREINPGAFSAPPSGQMGDAPRNFVRGFGSWQMDLAVRREFPIYERLKLQFRAEAFNVFNHPNFGFIDPFLGDPTFGQATSTLNSSLGVLSPLYQTGGPRSMQFALKLVF